LKSQFGKVDYSRRRRDRRKLTNYLRTGSFRSSGGAVYHSRNALQARMFLVIIAAVVFSIGFYHVLF